ncbi:hypothetical protein NST28_16040 [Paenibacillus sp. FSL R10-2791]|uniref:hypothetical protein n=1 Tax=Paenibacillus sp. FSL R10-2791 TaxID=2954695 RepID=UPI0030F647EB
MTSTLYNNRFNAHMSELLRNLHPNITSADNNRLFRTGFLNERIDMLGIFHAPHREDILHLRIDIAWDRNIGPCSQHKLIESFFNLGTIA